MPYFDLHQHLKNLEEHGLLRRITRLINKDTELHPLVRWQYRGLAEEDRKAWLFENVTDAKGRRYNMPVVVGALAGQPKIYYLGMGCDSAEKMDARWKKALAEPINPVTVTNAKCQDVVIQGDDLDREGNGLDRFPVPISTPGFDNGPYTTCSHWITADMDTGIQNIGNYRGQIKARRRIGVFPSGLGQDIYLHWKKAQQKGKHLPASLVIGAPPIVSYVSVQKIPYGVDEIGVAGGLAGEPIPMVKSLVPRHHGAGGGRDRHRRLLEYRIYRTGRAIRRVPRLHASAADESIHGCDGDHASQGRDLYFVAEPTDAERIVGDPQDRL